MVPLLFTFYLVCVLAAHIELLDYDPVANSGSTIISGNARFSVLTPRLVRLEYSSSGKFEDRATLAILNRNLTVPQYTSNTQNGVLTIQTASIALSYTTGQAFSANTLSVKGLDSTSKFSSWTYGQTNSGSANLLGTIRSLDLVDQMTLNCTQNAGVKVHDEDLHCEWGLISRDGWALVDETGVPVLNSDYWWDGNSVDTIDLYLFAHGYDYKAALYEYQLIGGKIILVPRNFAGIMWSRWYNIGDEDVKKIVEEYQERSLPLDVYILDMDWHTKYDWTGYTFDSHIFPVPSQTLDWLHNQELLTVASLHDADGVGNFEKQYSLMAQAVGIDPASGITVPFNLLNSTYSYALEDIVLQDVEKQGVDFWWIDWQQGDTGGTLAGGKQNPTIWTNHLRATDRNRRGETKRAPVLARFGGLGSHRYQVGFSGDVATLSWSNLAYQPYFSYTASNVGYGFWSHDLVGPSDDYELYTRWIQWGAVSGVFRTHDRGLAAGGCADQNPPNCAIVEVWKVPAKYFEANRNAMQLRRRLLPLIYTLYRHAFDSGVSPLRPMYYNFPQFDKAYLGDATGTYSQYLLGNDLLVAPVVTKSSSSTSMSFKTVWIPPGKWVEIETGVIHTGASDGSTILQKEYDLSEIPLFVRAGAILPLVPIIPGDTIGVASRQYSTLIFSIFPGGTQDSTQVYEDDGITTAYLDGKSYAWTNVSYTKTTGTNQLTVKVMIQTIGSFQGILTSRNYQVHLVNSLPPSSVSINGVNVQYSRFGGVGTWSYEGRNVVTKIETGSVPISQATTITVVSDLYQDSDFSGVKGAIHGAILSKANLDEDWSTPGSGNVGPAYVSDLASLGSVLDSQVGSNLTSFKATIASVPALLNSAIDQLGTNQLTQLYDADRTDSVLCGSADCVSANSFYTLLRIEGYQALQGDSDVIRLNIFWNETLTDNWATTDTKPPAGYIQATWPDGSVYSKQKDGTIPLQLWYNDARADHLTVASSAGVQYAKDNGYKVINDASNPLGWIFENPPPTSISRLRKGGQAASARSDYSVALLENANVVAS